MKLPLVQAGTLALLLASFTACQTGPGPAPSSPAEVRFRAADLNHDGKLDRREARTYIVTRVFRGVDVNHDGRVTRAEWHVHATTQGSAHFAQADTDHNGAVTLPEALAYARRHRVYEGWFRRADQNHDGYVTLVEARSFYAQREDGPR